MDIDSISFHPNLSSTEPHIGPDNLPVVRISEYVWEGYSVYDINLLIGNINVFSTIYSCWFMARHGGALWEKRWSGWANVIEPSLMVDQKNLVMPPNQTEVLNNISLFLTDKYQQLKTTFIDRTFL